MNKRLLFITCHRLDENNGGSNGSKGFIHCFAALFDDCSIIYPEFENTTPFIPAKYKLFPCHDSRTKIRKGIDMYLGVLGAIPYCVKKHLAEHKYDVIVIDHSVTGASLIKIVKATGAKVITIHHNVERDYLRDNIKERPVYYRYPYLYYAKKAECDCLKASDVNLTVTELDKKVFQSWYQNLHVHYWGNFEYREIPEKSFTHKNRNNTFIITGSLYFIQSARPIKEFVARYWPRIKQQLPHAKLIIAGRNPSQQLIQACGKDRDIQIVANPQDISQHIRQADYYICPICEGSGRKLRIIDGLKEGLQILCHDVSSSGYECLSEAGCLYTYHDEKTFDKSLHDMMSNPIEQAFVYDVFRKYFSTEEGIKRLRRILEEENIL